MLKIGYPKDSTVLGSLIDEYYNSVVSKKLLEAHSRFFSGALLKKMRSIPTVKEVLTMDLNSLLVLSNKLRIKLGVKEYKKQVQKIYNYDKTKTGHTPKRQKQISQFFARNQNQLNLCTCYYCNIDFINAFQDHKDFKDSLDYVKRATLRELTLIEGLSNKVAYKIFTLPNRKTIRNIDSLGKYLTPRQLYNLKTLKVNTFSSHFTLDHVINKAEHPIAALSFYNLVPSCYSCNSKFKRDTQIIKSDSQLYLSPTTSGPGMLESIKFKIFFNNGATLKKLFVSKISDISIEIEVTKNHRDVEHLISVLKLNGRYTFHKREILKLIKKRVKYDDSQLFAISKLLKQSVNKTRSDIFGIGNIDEKIEDYPLSKMKQDIAKQLGL